jgi:putative NADH-flavin reductase
MILKGKKLLIFGATGTIGRELVEQALEKGGRVTAFVRSPAKFDLQHENLRVAAGDVLDPASVEKALIGQEAVLIALGAGSKGTVRSEGTRNIVRAMENAGIRRLICLSSLGVGDSRDTLNFFWKYVMFGLLLRKAYADHEAQEDFVKQSGLDWTIVRPAAFTDDQFTGNYKVGVTGADKTLKLKISRADVADFMLKQVMDDRYIKKTPGISY